MLRRMSVTISGHTIFHFKGMCSYGGIGRGKIPSWRFDKPHGIAGDIPRTEIRTAFPFGKGAGEDRVRSELGDSALANFAVQARGEGGDLFEIPRRRIAQWAGRSSPAFCAVLRVVVGVRIVEEALVVPGNGEVELHESPAFHGVTVAKTAGGLRVRVDVDAAWHRHRARAVDVELEINAVPWNAVRIGSRKFAQDFGATGEAADWGFAYGGEFVNGTGIFREQPVEKRFVVGDGGVEIAVGHGMCMKAGC